MKNVDVMNLLQKHGESLVRIETNLDNHLRHHEKQEDKNSWLIPLSVGTVASIVMAFATIIIELYVR